MKSWRDHWPALWLLLILALVAVVRIRMLSMPLERDEGEYAYAGQLMLEGVPPYRLAYNMKMPGMYAAYALMMAVFGQTIEGIRLGFLFVNAAAIVLMYFLARRFLDRVGAVAASAAYALLSLSPSVAGFNTHATHFVVLAVLAATLVLLQAMEGGGLMGFFWGGMLFGIAFLMKQPGGAFALFGCTLLLWAGARRQPTEWRKDGARIAVYCTGVISPIVLTGCVLWRAGVWEKFWWWTVTYASVASTALPWKFVKERLTAPLTNWAWDEVFWILALVGLICLLCRARRDGEKFFFLSLLFFSAASVCPTFHFSNHYFVLMLPAVALLSAMACAEGASWLATQPLALARAAPWMAFGLVWGGVACSCLGSVFLSSPELVAAHAYGFNDFRVYPVIGDYLAQHSPPTATLAILGSEPELPFYAHRRSVTGYIYMYDLVKDQPFREQMEKEMISEVERGRPDYVIFVNQVLSWLPYPPALFDKIRDWLMAYTQNEYVPYGVVTFAPIQYYWGPDCLQRVPLNRRFVILFQRKSIESVNATLPKSAP